MTRRIWRHLLAAGTLVLGTAQAHAQAPDTRTLRAVISGELRSLDPVWTTAVQTRYHAFMVYDTLFGTDADQRIRPQMVETWTESPDKLTYTFTLREGLRFSDGAPVTAEDVVASWKRWAITDGAGQMTLQFITTLEAVDARTFRAVLKEPFGLLMFALAKPMAMPMFVMPHRFASLSAREQVTDPVGSGPFIMLRDEWVAGDRVTYARNPDYVPRAEPASGIAGGKRVNVDRVVWMNLPDGNTASAALQRGEVDVVEAPSLDLLPVLRRARGVTVQSLHNPGTQGTMRLNHLNPPFDNVMARRAIMHFTLQKDMITAVLGDPSQGQVCGALLLCGHPNGSEIGAEALISNDPAEVRIRRGAEMLRAAGYNNEPIVILHPQDQPIMHSATLVLADALRKGGVNVDVQTMDWATLVTRRTSKEKGSGGWHIFMTTGGSLGPSNPVTHIQMSGGCDRAFFGWPCDEELERLRAAWARETDPAKSRELLDAIQKRGMEIVVYIPFGQYALPSAWRDNVEGLLKIPETMVFWNVAKR